MRKKNNLNLEFLNQALESNLWQNSRGTKKKNKQTKPHFYKITICLYSLL